MKLRTYVTLAILLLLIVGIFADVEDQEGKNKKNKKSKTSKAPHNKMGSEKWNIMVYMMGNNVLSCETENSIQQMASISNTGNNFQFTIMWQISDLSFQCGNDTFMGVTPFEGARIYSVQKSSLTLIKDLGNVNTAATSTLDAFIVDALQSWDSTHHVLIFYGSGGGLVYGLDNGYPSHKTTAKKTTAKKTTAKKTTAKKTAKKTTAKKTAKKTTSKKTAKKTTAKKTAKKTTAKKTAKKTTAKKTAKKTTAKKTAKKTTAKKTAKKTTAKKDRKIDA